jgi:predicted nucleotidyltransferase component of viral defense system
MRAKNIYTETVSETLWTILHQLMKIDLLSPFRLVGGTALSLQLGHRMSVDIDFFTDFDYGSIDFFAIDKKLQDEFPFVEMQSFGNKSFGKAYYIGYNENDAIKLDMFYTDSFIRPIIEIDTIRMASLEEIAAMKMEVIGQNGRKKDFWDIHELMDDFSLEQMIDFYIERYPYSYSKEDIKNKLVDFQYADNQLNPNCLRGKYWELIMIDIQDAVNNLNF